MTVEAEQDMKKWILGVSVATMCGMASVAAAQGAAAQGTTYNRGKNEKPVTIAGCVRAGIAPDTFMLMDVSEVIGQDRTQAVPRDTRGRDVIYWLSSTNGLKVEAGQRVEVTGTLDMDKVDEGETKVTVDPARLLNSTTEIRSEGRKVTVETDSQPPVAPTATSGSEPITPKETTKRIVYRLHVTSVKGVDGVCQ
jgi:hypothetical protein